MKLHLVKNDIAKSTSLFANEADQLSKMLGKLSYTLMHIGSTSIPDTIGKGIIDIMLVADNDVDQAVIKERLLEKGYRQGELNKTPDGRLFFYKSQNNSFKGGTKPGDIHLHIVVKYDQKQMLAVKMRDYLLKNSDELEKYNQIKKDIAEKTQDRREYTRIKGAYIQELLKKIQPNLDERVVG